MAIRVTWFVSVRGTGGRREGLGREKGGEGGRGGGKARGRERADPDKRGSTSLECWTPLTGHDLVKPNRTSF